MMVRMTVHTMRTTAYVLRQRNVGEWRMMVVLHGEGGAKQAFLSMAASAAPGHDASLQSRQVLGKGSSLPCSGTAVPSAQEVMPLWAKFCSETCFVAEFCPLNIQTVCAAPAELVADATTSRQCQDLMTDQAPGSPNRYRSGCSTGMPVHFITSSNEISQLLISSRPCPVLRPVSSLSGNSFIRVHSSQWGAPGTQCRVSATIAS
jgi:hypothetical protein